MLMENPIEYYLEIVMILFTLSEIIIAYKLPDKMKDSSQKRIKIIQASMFVGILGALLIVYFIVDNSVKYIYLAIVAVLSFLYIMSRHGKRNDEEDGQKR